MIMKGHILPWHQNAWWTNKFLQVYDCKLHLWMKSKYSADPKTK